MLGDLSDTQDAIRHRDRLELDEWLRAAAGKVSRAVLFRVLGADVIRASLRRAKAHSATSKLGRTQFGIGNNGAAKRAVSS
ncbi:MAG TPA: hypothetical protein VGN89_07670, partial [Phenylobacterium sp.]|nr:hypothetical protein [Phenylobacterium sp.]